MSSDAAVVDAATTDTGVTDANASVVDSAAGPYACVDDAGTACNEVTNGGPFVETVASAGTAPTAAGGAIVLGVYYLTADVVYGGDASSVGTGYGLQQAMRISAVDGGGYLVEQVRYSTNDGCSRGALGITASGTMLTASDDCGDVFGAEGGPPQSVPYTATSTSVVISMSRSGDETEVQTYTLQSP
jgi:hypothetical protein